MKNEIASSVLCSLSFTLSLSVFLFDPIKIVIIIIANSFLRDVNKQSSMLEHAEIQEDVAFKHVSLIDCREAEVGGTDGGSYLGVSPVNNLYDLPHQQVDDELADFQDEVDYSGFSNSTESRRKLRMVLDDDDDDD